MRSVAIVGVGLIGGSFGLALRKAGFAGPILGVSSEPAVRAAVARGAIDRGVTLAEGAQAGLVFLSQPIGRIIDTLRRLGPLVGSETLVTDAGSTKREIVAAADGLRFLGGHPMAGKERRGVEEADADLFAGRTWVLTPNCAADLDTEAVRDFRGWLERVGARVVVLDPAGHDQVVSLTSHLPQLASTALAATVGENLPGHLEVAGPGLVDSTRLAMSSYELWRDILATNAGAIDAALQAYIAKLEHLRANLRTRDMQREFESAAELAQRLRAL